jgi:hypothetical protein
MSLRRLGSAWFVALVGKGQARSGQGRRFGRDGRGEERHVPIRHN